MPYIHNPESAQKILRTPLRKIVGKPATDTLDSSVMKTASDSNAKGGGGGNEDIQVASLVNWRAKRALNRWWMENLVLLRMPVFVTHFVSP